MPENLASAKALPLLNRRQKTENQARCAGFLVVDIIYCALKKPCPKEGEHNVLQQQNTHNKEEIANGFLGFLTQFCTSPLLYCFKLMCTSVLPGKYSGRLPVPKERKGNIFKSLLQRHKLCLGLPDLGIFFSWLCNSAVAACWLVQKSFMWRILLWEGFLSFTVQSALTANQNVAG